MNLIALGVVTLLVSFASAAIALRFGRDQRPEDAASVTAKVYRGRRIYAAALASVLAVAAGVSLLPLPYAAPAEAADVTVRATGLMWAWSLDGAADPLPVGKRIAFEVTAADVNHGFGIYDEAGHLLTQVQAMPGYTNTLHVTFDKPGTYHVVCMEFCGAIHHMMASTFEVR